MSSRRDSRAHLSERQNDALLEFENFKRKYLLVNKHITKLNSTLSVRVEELNAQISSLYVENIRLRASEISLASQLKREKERVHQVVNDAGNAVDVFVRQLTGIRTSLDIKPTKVGPSSPNVKRKLPTSPVQPPREATRLVKPPALSITLIHESDEEDGDGDEDDTPTRLVTTRRPSTSRLPLPKIVSPPLVPPPPSRPSSIPHINLAAGATKRKVRRDSELLTLEHTSGIERSPSPLVRPTTSIMRVRRSSSEREDEERETGDILSLGGPTPRHTFDGGIEPTETVKPSRVVERPRKVNRKGKARELLKERDRETDVLSTSELESSEGTREKDKRRFGIKDVTNSPRKAISEFAEEKRTEGLPSSTFTTPSTTHTPLFDMLTPRPHSSPNPQLLSAASTPATDGGFESGEGTAGRERRTRKSVNYAEPKLNTKMRKPDPLPETTPRPRTSGGTSTRRRKSTSTPSAGYPSDDEGDADVEGSGSGAKWTEGRRKTVHNPTTATVLSSRAKEPETPTDAYGLWGSEGRRHSMVV